MVENSWQVVTAGVLLIVGAAFGVRLQPWVLPGSAAPVARLHWQNSQSSHSGAPYNWTFYREFYEDLRNLTLEQAAAHYYNVGVDQGRIAAPFELRVVYTAGSGLCNQLYHHLHAFMMARALGVGILMPPVAGREGIVMPAAVHRRSFGDRHKSKGEPSQVVWRQAPLGTLFDLEKMTEYWSPRGVAVLPTPDLIPVDPAVAPPRTPLRGRGGKRKKQQRQQQDGPRLRYDTLSYRRGGRCIAADVPQTLGRFYMSRGLLPVQKYAEAARAAISEAAKPTLLGDPSNQISCVYLEHAGTMMALDTTGIRDMAREAAGGLFFNSTLVYLAREILAAIDPHHVGFEGLHLRLERDGEGWQNMFGGVESMMKAYLESMERAQFSNASVVYVASGLLSYNASEVWMQVEQNITRRGLAKAIMYKEKFLQPSKLAGLYSEQLALVDFLVLLRANKLVGFAGSSFSYLLVELRALQGRPKSTGVLIEPHFPNTLFDTGGQLSD